MKRSRGEVDTSTSRQSSEWLELTTDGDESGPVAELASLLASIEGEIPHVGIAGCEFRIRRACELGERIIPAHAA